MTPKDYEIKRILKLIDEDAILKDDYITTEEYFGTKITKRINSNESNRKTNS